jgi:hypothetical protein
MENFCSFCGASWADESPFCPNRDCCRGLREIPDSVVKKLLPMVLVIADLLRVLDEEKQG